MTTITNYTTYDQAYYYADLKRVPRLTDEARQDLLTSLPRIENQETVTQVQHQLIESYLPLAKYLAITLCPKSEYHRRLPDLIGAVNLALVEIITGRDLLCLGGNLTSYLAACLRGTLKGAIANENVIKMSYDARTRALAQGLDQVLNIVSLDAYMHWDEDDEREEPNASPITPSAPAPERDPIKCVQVEEYLSYLPPRTQTILRLRYGLSEEDERPYSVIEIAAHLGLSREIVNSTIHDGLAKLRALVEGKAALSHRNGRVCISYPELLDRSLKPEQEAALQRAYTRLEAEGTAITGCRLAKTAGVGINRTLAFLRAHRQESPKETRARERQGRLEEAYSRLAALGKPFTGATLARAAHVDDPTARSFLKERRSTSDATA